MAQTSDSNHISYPPPEWGVQLLVSPSKAFQIFSTKSQTASSYEMLTILTVSRGSPLFCTDSLLEQIFQGKFSAFRRHWQTAFFPQNFQTQQELKRIVKKEKDAATQMRKRRSQSEAQKRADIHKPAGPRAILRNNFPSYLFAWQEVLHITNANKAPVSSCQIIKKPSPSFQTIIFPVPKVN